MTPEELDAIKEKIKKMNFTDPLGHDLLLCVEFQSLISEVERAWAEIEEKNSYIIDLEEKIEFCDCDDYENDITDGFQRDFINSAFEKDKDDDQTLHP